MRIDCHSHTQYSRDACTSVRSYLGRAKKLGLTMAVTDHGTTAAWEPLEKEAKRIDVEFIKACEYKVFDNDGAFLGEMIPLFMHAPIEKKNIHEFLDEARQQDCLVFIPHAFDWVRKPFKQPEKFADKIDAMEVFNARTHLNGLNEQCEAFAERHGLPKVAGSDAHIPAEIGNAWVEVDAADLEEARKKIRKGETKTWGKWGGVIPHVYTQLAKRNLCKGL